jgi:hypothetical protein
MTKRDLATIAFSLIGLWLIASALIGLASLPYVWETAPAESRRFTIGAIFLPSLVTLGLGVPIWMSAEWFALRVFPETPSDSVRIESLHGEALLATAFAIMGVFFIADGIPALVNSAALFVQSYTTTTSVLGRDTEQQRLLWSAAAKAHTAGGVARLLVGVALLAGPARLGAALAALRKDLRGTLQDEEPSKDEPTSKEP